MRTLVLSGFMATGKSTVGRRVAARAGVPFVDLDAEIERRAGVSVPELFRLHGEPGFRALERATLEELLADPVVRVLAVGGGALIAREVRLGALDRAVVVTLTAPPAAILARARAQGGRPLLEVADPAARVAELLDARRLAYAECHGAVSTGDDDPDAAAAAVAALWQRDAVAVAAGEASYTVEIGRGLVGARAGGWCGASPVVLAVSDTTVAGLHGAAVLTALAGEGRRVGELQLTPGEEHKDLHALERIWRRALELGADRAATFVALGGGVVGDLTGFAAATYMRGVRWIGLPTSLLAMVDASVGGKTAIDLGATKNVVGAFWQPSAVLCDLDLQATEGARGHRSALAEVVKTALLGDPALLDTLEQHLPALAARDPELLTAVVRASVRVKARVVSLDEREAGPRAWLNLGHTVGHALEASAGLGTLTHGEAVSLGLVAALRLGVALGVTPPELAQRGERLLDALGLPTRLDPAALERARPLLGADKKRAGADVRFVLLEAPGRPRLQRIALDRLGAELPALSEVTRAGA